MRLYIFIIKLKEAINHTRFVYKYCLHTSESTFTERFIVLSSCYLVSVKSVAVVLKLRMKFLKNLFVLAFCTMLLHVVAAGLTCEQDLAVVKEKRLGAIRNQILTKLNMTEAPRNPSQPRVLTPDILAAYEVIKDAFERDAIARAAGCVDNNYFARKVSLFVPETTGKEILYL